MKRGRRGLRRQLGTRPLLLVCGLMTAAGAAAGQSVSIGLKEGVIYRAVWGNGLKFDQTASIGGVSLISRFGPRFALQPEALLAPERQSGNDGMGIVREDEKVLKIPVLAKMYMPMPWKGVLPMAYVGPWAGFRVGCRHYDALGREMSCAAQQSSLRYGLAWGGGVELPAGPADLVLDLRGEIALRRAGPVPGTLNQELTENASMLLAGISLPLGKRIRGDWQAGLAPLRPARTPAGTLEPVLVGDRVRAVMVNGAVQGTVLVSDRDSLVIQQRDPRFAPRLPLSASMVQRVDVSLGRQSPVTPTLVGAGAGTAVALLYITIQHLARNLVGGSDVPVMHPYILAAPIVGAALGHAAGRERWRESTFPERPKE